MYRIGVVVLCILCCFFSLAACQNTAITEPYEYPVVPGMEEWTKLGSLQEMAEACQIPEGILSNMTTEALVETVANYPLWGNVIAYEDRQLGLEHVKDYFNGLQELCTRDDATGLIEKYIAEKLQYSEGDPDETFKKFKTWYLEEIMENIRSN